MAGRRVPVPRRITDEELLANGQLFELANRQSRTVEQLLAAELKEIINKRVPNTRRAEQLYREVYDFLTRTIVEHRPFTDESNGPESTD